MQGRSDRDEKSDDLPLDADGGAHPQRLPVEGETAASSDSSGIALIFSGSRRERSHHSRLLTREEAKFQRTCIHNFNWLRDQLSIARGNITGSQAALQRFQRAIRQDQKQVQNDSSLETRSQRIRLLMLELTLSQGYRLIPLQYAKRALKYWQNKYHCTVGTSISASVLALLLTALCLYAAVRLALSTGKISVAFGLCACLSCCGGITLCGYTGCSEADLKPHILLWQTVINTINAAATRHIPEPDAEGTETAVVVMAIGATAAPEAAELAMLSGLPSSAVSELMGSLEPLIANLETAANTGEALAFGAEIGGLLDGCSSLASACPS